MIRKMGLTLILAGLLLTAVGCSGGKSTNTAANTTDTGETAAVKTTINEYFKEYFDSQKDANYAKMKSTILAGNDNTQLNESFRETMLVSKYHFNTKIKADYKYKIEYQKVVISGDEANMELTVDLDFQYENAPDGMRSGLYGIKYSFGLKNDGSKWVITQIDSDLQEYQYFKNCVQKQMDQNAASSKAEAINQVAQSLKNRMKTICNNIIYLKGEVNTGTTMKDAMNNSVTPDSLINKSVYVSCKSFDYSPTAAVEYALTYAEAAARDRMFYSTNVDCTNFVSQCIWAGYVGFKANAINTAKNYRDNKVGMIYTQWHAGTGGATTSWENVDELYRYLSDTTKAAGPKVTVYNNNTRYTGVPVSSINIGDVLQVKRSWDPSYDHSVIVTKKDSSASYYTQVYISSHTNDRKNFSLMDVINGFGGENNCYMRRLVPQSGCYMKKN